MSSDDRVSLLGLAMQAPDDVSEVGGTDGRVARIERHPSYPGAKHVYLDPAPENASTWSQWRLPAISDPPTFYPDGLPFVAGLPCFVFEGQGRLRATWRDESALPSTPETLQRIRSAVPQELSKLFGPDHPELEDPNERLSEFREAFRALRDRWTKPQMSEWLVGASAFGEPDERILEVFQTILDQLEHDGWIEQPLDPESEASAVRSARLIRGDRQRELRLTAPFGIGLLTLSEKDSGLLDSA